MSLIEVLVAVLLVSIGLLGAAAMQVRAIDYTLDTERRQMAAMLASELMETMRGDTANVLDSQGMPKADLGGYAKTAGKAKAIGEDDAVDASSCTPLAAKAEKRFGCWLLRARQLMPEINDTLVEDHFAVELADATSGVVAVTVAWPVKPGQCLTAKGDDDGYCTYTMRSQL